MQKTPMKLILGVYSENLVSFLANASELAGLKIRRQKFKGH